MKDQAKSLCSRLTPVSCLSTLRTVEVQFTPDQSAVVLAAVDEAEASLAGGEGRIITQQSMRDLAGEVKQRGRDRLAAEQPPAR